MSLLMHLVPVGAPWEPAIQLSHDTSGRYMVELLTDTGYPERVDSFDTLERALLRVAGLVKEHLVYIAGGDVGGQSIAHSWLDAQSSAYVRTQADNMEPD